MDDDETKAVGTLLSRAGLIGKLTPTGYKPRTDQTLEEWDEDGELLVAIDHSMSWALGDWLHAGGDQFGQECWQARAIQSKSLDWWQQVERVSTSVPPENRVAELPWSYHQAVASLGLEDQRRLLQEALDKDWEREHLRAQVALVKNGNTPLELEQARDDYKDAKDGKPKVDKAKPKGLTALAREAKKAEAIRKRQARIDNQEKKAAAKAEEKRRRKAESAAKARGETLPPPATPEMPDEVYQVLLVDPPWRYEDPPMGVTGRSIENHYPTMALADLVKLPVPDLAADDAVMFMWATAPNLPAAMTLMESWGFQYRTEMVWYKSKAAMGYYVRNQHEKLLIGKRGEPVMPAEKDRPPSVIEAPSRQHSQKPDIFLQILERMYPQYSRIYLWPGGPLPRGHRDSWATWGKDHRVEMQQAAE